MGRIALILSFLQTLRNGARVSDVKIDTGGGANITSEHFTAPGDDSNPLTTDYALSIGVAPTGREAIAGYLDPLNTPQAQPGDKRIYARDAATGAVVVEIWLQNDGTATVSNDNGSFVLAPDGSMKGLNASGSFELDAAGDFVVNGVTIDAAGVVTIPSSLLLNGKEIAGHDHSQDNDSGGNTEQDTGPNN